MVNTVRWKKTLKLVREAGLEPAHHAALDPKSSASTSSATLAIHGLYGDMIEDFDVYVKV